MRIIDAHQHFWDPRSMYYPLLRGADSYLPADYLRDTRGHNVSGTVHIEGAHDPDDPVGEARWLHQQSDTWGLPSAVVGYADLRDPALADVLDAHLSYPEVRGVRQMLDVDPRGQGSLHGLLDDDTWLSGLRMVAERELCFVAQVATAKLARLAAVAARVPGLTIVLCHAGLRGADALQQWSRWVAGLELLAEHPNVAVTVSGLAGLLPRWDPALAVRVTRTVLDIYGPERTMFGSNFPVDREVVTFGELVLAAAEASMQLSPPDREQFFWGTAKRIYRLDEPSVGR